MVLGRDRQVGTPYRPTSGTQAVERLRAGHFVDEVEVDVEQVRLTLGMPDYVCVPDLLGQCAPHHNLDPAPDLRLACRDGSISAWTTLAESAFWTRPPPSWVRSRAAPSPLRVWSRRPDSPGPTAHRLAVALEHHRLVARDLQGRFVLGPRLGELAAAAGEDRLQAAAAPVLMALRDLTGESAQLYRRQGDERICVAAAERLSGLRDSVPIGAVLSMSAGSAAQILLAWEEPERLHRGLRHARFTATVLAGVRRRGWAQSVAEREPGVASVSAPVRGPGGRVVAAVSVSGPIERLSRSPGRIHAPAVLAGAAKLTEALKRP